MYDTLKTKILLITIYYFKIREGFNDNFRKIHDFILTMAS